ncbi:hypothetical protein [Rhizobium sp. Leaf262]|uniref:hypothetical protein n=1 Tax=Rhizobium sp. Leaf262 TaxID=1736312 RepID=UPI000715F8FA|nr:hypothetical protein [Rhizobium sp. Leaf262]KQO75614.1 hypothetical protein ASF29_10335 [Rhizobium sp. Leaf262]
MADFVAVIRKAVDGLANNTPENRAKVYDKARSAVVRQLENMKPRPPEELLKRQILKLDTAIAEVEGEYSEALPAAEEDQSYDAPVAAPAAPDVSSPYYEEEVARDQRQDEENDDVAAEPAPVAPVEYDHEPQYAAQDEDQETVAHERYVEPEPVDAAPVEEAPTYFTTATEEPRHVPEPYETVEHAEPEAEPQQAEPEEHAHENWVGQDTPAEQAWAHQAEEPVHYPAEVTHEEPAPHADGDVFHENTPLPYAASYAAPSPYYQDSSSETVHDEPRHDDVHFGDAPQFGDNVDHRVEDEPKSEAKQQSRAIVEDYSTYFQDTSLDLPAKTTPGLPRADDDPFAPQAGQKDDKERTPWDDLEELIGYDGASGNTSANGNKNEFDSGISSDGIPAAAYRTKKKPRRNYAGLVLSLCGVVLLAGGAYALWVNRDALNDMVGGLVQSAQTGTTTPSTPTNTASNTATPPATTTPAQPNANGQQPATPTQTAAVDDGSVSGTKFTQRLLADGTEKDEGAGPGVNGQPVTAEGQSVYVQNEEAPPASAQTAPAGTTAPAGQVPAAQQPAAASGHRMFLYEEVLGQTVPTAIEGTVSWSLQNEQDANGKPSATVQGQITIPGRGLSALITFKRNTDPSLPASHLVEIVFSVGAGFEGGAIDSVQRIAMKSTEQDRGNALIAVPAKITDDFHMIALNDFPDALKTNLELMRTRDWIDIPVSYRNGRRALLTLQKGADGKAAFETALREWSAAVPATGQ